MKCSAPITPTHLEIHFESIVRTWWGNLLKIYGIEQIQNHPFYSVHWKHYTDIFRKKIFYSVVTPKWRKLCLPKLVAMSFGVQTMTPPASANSGVMNCPVICIRKYSPISTMWYTEEGTLFLSMGDQAKPKQGECQAVEAPGHHYQMVVVGGVICTSGNNWIKKFLSRVTL